MYRGSLLTDATKIISARDHLISGLDISKAKSHNGSSVSTKLRGMSGISNHISKGMRHVPKLLITNFKSSCPLMERP